jgi:hypothetical protein
MVGAPSKLGRLVLAWAAAAMTYGPSVAAQDLNAEGHCRDGLPHGAYELRGSGNQLRAAGAFARGRRMGSFLFWSPSGTRVAQLPFDDDHLSGTLALWFPAARGTREGSRRLEATYVDGRPSGAKRSWYQNGNPRTSLRYENGVLVEAQAFDETGKRLPDTESRALAARDAVADDTYVDSLNVLVRTHPPRCDAAAEQAAPPAQRGKSKAPNDA